MAAHITKAIQSCGRVVVDCSSCNIRDVESLLTVQQPHRVHTQYLFLPFCDQAYAKFPNQVITYGQLQLPMNPLKLQSAAAAVADQITRNMVLPEAPMLGAAPDGTIIKTMAGVTLQLVVK